MAGTCWWTRPDGTGRDGRDVVRTSAAAPVAVSERRFPIMSGSVGRGAGA